MKDENVYELCWLVQNARTKQIPLPNGLVMIFLVHVKKMQVSL